MTGREVDAYEWVKLRTKLAICRCNSGPAFERLAGPLFWIIA